MGNLGENLRDRFAPLIDQERERFLRMGDVRCDLPPRRQAWEITRVIEGFENDELSLRAWMRTAGAEEMGPIIFGYDALLREVERGEAYAVALAQEIVHAQLCSACSLLARHWMLRMVWDAHPPFESGRPSAGEGA